MVPHALDSMASQLRGRLEVLEAELADVQLGQCRVFLGVRTLVPDFNFEPTQLNVLGLLGVGQSFEGVLVVLGSSGLTVRSKHEHKVVKVIRLMHST
jgi:hypothetical protein